MEFQALDWTIIENNLYCFGRKEDGLSISCEITNITYPFYINIDDIDTHQYINLVTFFQEQHYKYTPIKRKIFDECILDKNGEYKLFKFLRMDCKNIREFYTLLSYLRSKPRLKLYNSQIKPLLSFFHRFGFSANGWFRIEKFKQKQGICDTNIIFSIDDLVELDMIKPSCFKIASYDIETEGTNPDDCKVFQIGLSLEQKETTQYLFSLGKCDPIKNVTVFCYPTEKELIRGFVTETAKLDFDIITGYNTFGFDNEFLYKRAKLLGVDHCFNAWSRHPTRPVSIQSKQSGKGEGFNTQFFFNIVGRVQMDLLPLFRKNFKLDKYTLGFVSQTFLNDDKVDLDYKEMWRLWKQGKPADLAIIGEYCAKDTLLPLKLIRKLYFLVNAMEYANISYFPLGMLFLYGETSKSFSQICRQAERERFVIYDTKRRGVCFQGATVLEPTKGMYLHEKVAVFDFKSLYPSIMIAHNLCPSTICNNEDYIKQHPNEFYTVDFKGNPVSFFQKRKGVVPTILERLLNERSKVKKLMKSEKNSFLYDLYNAKQLALKVSCNSIYGFFGVLEGIYPKSEISNTVTLTGRQMIHDTKKMVEKNYPGTVVVYGDTDSVMVKFSQKSDEELFQLGHKISKELTENLYKAPNELEFEKLYDTFILYGKKMYSGVMRENINGAPKLDNKGIKIVRRETSNLTRNVLTTILEILHKEKNTVKAIQFAKQYCQDVSEGKIDFKEFVMSKKLGSNYKNPNLPHAFLAKKLEKRHNRIVYQPGDRVEYVFYKRSRIPWKNSEPQYNRVDDPTFIKQNSGLYMLDYKYYIEKQLKQAIIDCLCFTQNDLNEFFDILLEKKPRVQKLKIDDFFKKK